MNFHIAAMWEAAPKETRDTAASQSSLPPQYRALDAEQAFPRFERRNPKRTCLLAYGPFLLAGILELAVCIRLRRASNGLRAHPPEKFIDPMPNFL